MVGAVAAVDLGATSGRVMLGYVGHNELRLRHIARFPNQPVRIHEGVDDAGAARYGLHWNILELYRSLLAGIGTAVRDEPDIRSIAVDSWAVDYALMQGGRMLGNPYHYRDPRTEAGARATHALVSFAELYAANGLQFLPFNTLYQLAAECGVPGPFGAGQAGSIPTVPATEGAAPGTSRPLTLGNLSAADSLLLIPDLVTFWLTGEARAEKTNASTTGLLNVHTREWDLPLIERLGLPASILPTLVEAGTTIGTLLPEVALELGAPRLPVTAVGSHDTASAVAAIPATSDDFAYISSGTWSLVGVELEHPVVSDASREANFTNEGGVDGRVRFLQNVSGLWMLSESVRTWERDGQSVDLPALLAAAEELRTPIAVFDAADPRFITPGDMPGRIAQWCVEHGQPVPHSPAEVVRSILESLAEAYARSLELAVALAGKTVNVIHIVGGGSQNELLCQLTANHTGRTVLAGPVEATAIGNVLIQARAQGLVVGDLESLRAIVATAFPPARYLPRGARLR
ncbi:rhamnulokinase family protein [soil metagenome]